MDFLDIIHVLTGRWMMSKKAIIVVSKIHCIRNIKINHFGTVRFKRKVMEGGKF
jgi:hypothetical protein